MNKGQNKVFFYLAILAIGILLVLSMYEIFLKPTGSVPTDRIVPLSDYFGEDILERIQ